MFFAQNQYGVETLRAAFDYLPIEAQERHRATARFLGIAGSTLTAYLSGKSDPPRSVVYALWHESDLGRAVTSEHSERGAALWRGLAKSQGETLAKLHARIDDLTATIEALKREHRAAARPVAANEEFFERYR